MEKLNQEYIELKNKGLDEDSKELKKLISQNDKIMAKKEQAMDKYYEEKDNPPARLLRIQKIESVI